MACVKVKPWGKDQGDYVLIEEEDFDPDTHELYEEPAVTPAASGGDGPQKPRNKA